jgi:hypothetical protein
LGAHQRFKAKTSGLDLDNAKARAKSKPSNKGKKNGKNFLAATAPSCRQKTVDRAVVVIDGMTPLERQDKKSHRAHHE